MTERECSLPVQFLINIFFIFNYNGSCVNCFPTHNFVIIQKKLEIFALHNCLTFLNKTAFLIVSDSFINMTLFPS